MKTTQITHGKVDVSVLSSDMLFKILEMNNTKISELQKENKLILAETRRRDGIFNWIK